MATNFKKILPVLSVIVSSTMIISSDVANAVNLQDLRKDTIYSA